MMATVRFTPNIQRHVTCDVANVRGDCVRQVLDEVFALNPTARGYVLDDRGTLRHHMMVFVNGQPIRDKKELSDAVPAGAEIYVMQALSGG